jgi:hypothetical protein
MQHFVLEMKAVGWRSLELSEIRGGGGGIRLCTEGSVHYALISKTTFTYF